MPATYRHPADRLVCVVDDEDLIHHIVAGLLGEIEVPTRCFSSAEAFIDQLPQLPPCCLVTDNKMEGMSGVQLISTLRQRGSLVPAIVLSAYVGVEETVTAMKLGAVTVLRKPCTERELQDAVADGFRVLDQQVVTAKRRDELAQTFAQLTKGQWQAVAGINEGAPNKVLAGELGVSIRTIEKRRSDVFRKLKVESVAGVVHLLHEAATLGIHLPLPRVSERQVTTS